MHLFEDVSGTSNRLARLISQHSLLWTPLVHKMFSFYILNERNVLFVSFFRIQMDALTSLDNIAF